MDPPSAKHVIVGGGDMGQRIRSFDWSTTPLGPIERWPQSLRSAVSILLPSKAQIVLFWGPDLITIYNDAYRPAFGAKHPWALGQPARESWREVWDVLQPLFDGVMRTGEAFWAKDHPFLLERHGYAEETYFDVSYDPVRDESGGVGGVFCIVSETTGRVLGERRLRVLRELAVPGTVKHDAEVYAQAAAVLAQHSADVPYALLFQLDPGATAARLVEAVNVARDTLATGPAIELSSSGSSSGAATGLRAAVSSGRAEVARPAEFLTRLPSTASADRLLVLPLRSGTQPAGILVAGVSRHLALEGHYRDFFDLVASRVSAAIGSVHAYEQERRRAEALAELDRAKTAFFSNVSHEFRTPLTLLLGPLEDLLRDAASALAAVDRERVEIAHRNALRLLKLVNTLLDFSRIEAGRIEARYEPTDLGRYTADLASAFRSLVERAGLRFVVQCDAGGPEVFVDREMWEKIVLNLLSNAFKYTLDGEIRVSLRHRAGKAELSVSDTGTGIAEQDLPQIFERFHRVHNPRARTQEGTGIGLALVAELVRLHGGTIDAVSELDRGSTFTVSLPIGSAHLPADRIGARRTLTSTAIGLSPFVEEADRWIGHDHEVPAAPASLPGQASTAPAARVLLADDNADMREYLCRLLGRYWAVEAVANGADALEIARQRVPDLVLADVMMPGLHGFELLRALRADPLTQAVPVMLLSARAGDDARVEGLAAGADDYLVKPFSARELVARVASHLELARVRREGAARERAAQAETERAREHVGRILESITDAFVAFDHEWRFTYINAAAAAILGDLGRTREALMGRNVWTEFPHAVGTEFEKQYRRAMAEQVHVDFEAYDSSLGRWFGAHVYPSPDGLSVYLTDVTAHKQAELALRRSQEELEDFFENAAIALHRAGPDGVVLRANQAELDLLGYRRDEYEGRPIADFHVDREVIDDILARLAAREPVRNREARLRCKDGTIKHVLIDSNVMWGPRGEFLHTRCFTRDITELKRAEQERLQLLASERSARSEAEAANRSKDQFLAVLSHELRTPLNAMVGWTGMLQSGQLDAATTQRALEAIARSTKIQAQLIDELLDVSRIITGKLHVELRPVRLLPALEAALESVSQSAARKSIHLESRLDRGEAMILGDETRLRQIVTNLLVNAIKFTPEGGRVSLELTRGPREAVIVVSDTGIGITAEDLPRIFMRFHQADRPSQATSGLGLGLAIVDHLVREHRGEIAAHSEGPGRGARFTMRFPLAPTAPAADTVLPPRIDGPVQLRGLPVLVVEDDLDSRDLMMEILKSRGATVMTAASAQAALAALADFRPAVLISDIGLPDIDGYTFMRQVRSLPGPVASIPAIALTAYARPEDRAKALAVGFQRHIAKPIDPQLLCAVVAELAPAARAV